MVCGSTHILTFWKRKDILNRALLVTYLTGVPFAALIVLYVLGFSGINPGFPLVWDQCLLILVTGRDGCGYYVDGSALFLDVLFYTAWGYALLGVYKLVRVEKSSASHASKTSIG